MRPNLSVVTGAHEVGLGIIHQVVMNTLHYTVGEDGGNGVPCYRSVVVTTMTTTTTTMELK